MDQRQPAGAAAAVACLQPCCPRLNFSRSWQQGGGHSAPSSKLRASSRSLGRSRWLCSPPGAVGMPFWAGQGRAGQGRALQREQYRLAWGGEQTGLICTADLHRLRVSEQDHDRLCQIPFHRKAPNSSLTSQISGKRASSGCDAGCTCSPSPGENPSCGMGTAAGPGARSSRSGLGSCWEVPRETRSW